jgi:hypothetical protein
MRHNLAGIEAPDLGPLANRDLCQTDSVKDRKYILTLYLIAHILSQLEDCQIQLEGTTDYVA